MGIPGVFTLGEDSIEDIEAIKKLKEDLREKEEKYNKTNEFIQKKKYEKEELEKNFKEDAWKQILKCNENDFDVKNNYEQLVYIGDVVVHNKFGPGEVVDIDLENNRILVKFNDGEKMFIFPQAFEKGFLKQ